VGREWRKIEIRKWKFGNRDAKFGRHSEDGMDGADIKAECCTRNKAIKPQAIMRLCK